MSRAYRNATDETAEYAKKIEKNGVVLRTYDKIRRTTQGNAYDKYVLKVCEYKRTIILHRTYKL